jgi:hypothetical protein
MNSFPDGWNEEKVQNVINYYENQTEEEVLGDEEAFYKPVCSVNILFCQKEIRHGRRIYKSNILQFNIEI